MMDIVSIGNDLGLFDTQVPRAANILSIQVESLEYAPDLGIDLKYFLQEEFRFQNESFRSYLIEVLANRSINVVNVSEAVENLFTKLTFNIGQEQSNTGLIAR